MKLDATAMTNLEWLTTVIEIGEEDLVASALSAFSPYQPGSMRQKMVKRQVELGRKPELIPTPDELWSLMLAADFRCTLNACRSQLRIGIDRIDTARGYEADNIRVLCGACNRRISRQGAKQESLSAVVFHAIRAALAETPDEFPSDMEIKRRAGLKDLSGSIYLVRFLRHRWEQHRGAQPSRSRLVSTKRRTVT
jgi:hypothetical protein